MMIEEMNRLFLASRKRGTDGARRKCSDKTIKAYRRNLDIFAGWLQTDSKEGGITDYSSIRKLHVLDFVDWMEAKVAAKEWARATALQALRSLKAFFNWVDRDEDCQAESLKGLQRYIPVIEKNPTRKFIPSSEQMRKFKNSFDTDNLWGYRNYIVTCLILTNGLRISEVCNIKMDQVKLDDKTLIADGKTGPRLVPITTEMVRLIRGWLRRRQEGLYAKESPYLFISKRGPQMDDQGFGKAFRKHVAKHGLSKVSAHTIRHFFATNYLKSGGDVIRLKNITGHTTTKMLEDYVHMAELGGDDAKEKLELHSPLKNL